MVASKRTKRPSWDRLYRTAAAQEGHFSARQAAAAGFSPQLLAKHLRAKKVIRPRRAIYRLVHFPPGEHEDLIVAWLWSDREGVFSHETALLLHDLSDTLPARAHLTLPASWRHRRLRVPKGLAIHYGDVADRDRTWIGALPTTSVRRTLNDCLHANVAPELIAQASSQAAARGLISTDEVMPAPALALLRNREVNAS